MGRVATSVKARSERVLLQGLRRACRPRTVAMFEYEMRPRARYGWGSPPHQGLLELFREREPEAEGVVEAVTSLSDDILAIPGGRDPSGALTWDNDWWGSVDAMVQYTALRDRKPKNYVEVGSGFSTRFARRAISDHGLPTKITSIDPYPRAEIDAICDTVVRRGLEEADLSVFQTLTAGDVVLIDCSHTAFMNSDAVVAFLDVLPLLAPGVLVGVDDIFLPWDYHPTWQGRWYGEQYLLASMLLGGAEGWTIRFPAWYMTKESESRHRFEPLWEHIEPLLGRNALSFWLERSP